MNDPRAMTVLPSLATKLINVTLYELGWLCCVLGGAWGHPIAGGLAAMTLAGVHLLLATARKSEFKLMLLACLLGVMVDTAQQQAGFFTFQTDPSWPLWLPFWVFVIWAQFATLFRYALFWLRGRYLLAAAIGLVGGPLAYWAGIRLGAAEWGPQPFLSILCLATVWAVVTPGLVFCSTLFGAGEGQYRRPFGRATN